MSALLKYIKEQVSPEEYYSWQFPDIKWHVGSDEARVMSPFLVEAAPSFSVNRKTGAWHSFCAADKRGGRTIISFHAALYEVNYRRAATEIYHKLVHPIVPDAIVNGYYKELLKTKTVIGYIKNRFISKEVITEKKIGWNGERITIPIKSEFGFYINIKLYSPSKQKGTVKMINYTTDEESRSFGSPTMLYPIEVMEKSKVIVICEGEWDVLALLSLGVSAVTTTAGASSWPTQFNPLFANKIVSIAPDNDGAGKDYVGLIVKNLKNVVRRLKRIQIPEKQGKDVNAYIQNWEPARKKKCWVKLMSSAKVLLQNKAQDIDTADTCVVSLDKASEDRWFNEVIKVDALVTGKGSAPYLLPRQYRVTCAEGCEECTLTKKCEEVLECELDMQDPNTLKMIDMDSGRLKRLLFAHAGIPYKQGCVGQLKILSTFNVEHLLMIPSLDSNSTQYVTMTGYYIGHGLKSNKAYRFEGKSLPHPKTQAATLLLNDAHPAQNQVESFKLTPEMLEDLKRFQPKKLNLMAHLMSMADWQSRNITKIMDRPDLHIAIDLVYHSVAKFSFNRELVPRGMLDVLVMGDTRCGKGYVAERLMKYYGVGEMASGENCSFAGLVGGAQQIGGRWFITWGLIPLNNNRLVVIDEVSSMGESDIGHMSRVRSEGVAEIAKIVRESTQANTRLLWLSNPRTGRPLNTYNYGVETIPELMGANEDVSRLDFAMTVASDEVSTERINSEVDYDVDPEKYPEHSCRNLVLWAWSREPEQVIFRHSATKKIIEQSIELGRRYSSTIPLIQSENIRIKLAKISAALAARVFSTDHTGTKLLITSKHVQCAIHFLKILYDKPSMGYDMYSRSTLAASSKKQDQVAIVRVFDKMGADKKEAIRGLISLHRITPDNLADYVGDNIAAKMLIGDLVKLGCIARMEKGQWYMKSPTFNGWLRKVSRETRL